MRVESLQLMRAVAALGVVVFHAHAYFITIKLYPGEPISNFFNAGFAGVELFFVLSGFVMAFIHWKDLGLMNKVPVFLLKRVMRIIPLYWFFLLFLVVFNFLFLRDELNEHHGIDYFINSFFLIPGEAGFILEVAWTLTFEFVFYAFFSLLIMNKLWGMWIFLSWQGAVLLNVYFSFSEALVFSSYNSLFFMGVLSALAYKYLDYLSSVLVFLFGLFGFALVSYFGIQGYWEGLVDYRTLLYGIFAAMLMAGIVNCENIANASFPKLFMLLGDSSYSIYLSHGFALSVMSFALSTLGLTLLFPKWLVFLILIISGVVAGVLLHYFIEKRLLNWSKGFIANRYP